MRAVKAGSACTGFGAVGCSEVSSCFVASVTIFFLILSFKSPLQVDLKSFSNKIIVIPYHLLITN